MTRVARPVFLISLLAALAAVGLVGCGGEIHPAIHDPLLVMPPEVRIVLQADIIASRSLNNFLEIEQFVRNRDDDRSLRNVLPFDYQEFVEHWQLDLFQNIDKMTVGVYESGVLWVMVGQFDSAHLVSLAQEEQSIAGTEQRGNDQGDYTVYHHALRDSSLLPDRTLMRDSLHQMSDVGENLTTLAQRVYSSQDLYEAWPTQNIWIRSSNRSLITAALDLWDGQGLENLHDDRAFEDLFTARPHSALIWMGMPTSTLVPHPWNTLEVELDIRDYISPKIILGYATEADAESDFPNIDRQVEAIASIFQAQPGALTDPLTGSASGGRVEELEMAEFVARAAETLQTRVYGHAKVIEITMDLPISDFKQLMVLLGGMTPR